MLLLDFQLRMLRLAGEMMGAAAATLTPSPAESEGPSHREATAVHSATPPVTRAETPADGASPLLMFPRVASGVSKALSEVQPAPRREAQYPFAALFPFAHFTGFPTAMGATVPTMPPFAWPAPVAPQTCLAMLWPGFFGSPMTAWTSPWANMMAWTRFVPFPFGAASQGLSPFMLSPWAMPALRPWFDLATIAPSQNASAYRSASGHAVAQVVARALLLSAGTLTAMAMAVNATALA